MNKQNDTTQNKATKTIGQIKEDYYLRQFVRSGKINNCEKFEIDVRIRLYPYDPAKGDRFYTDLTKAICKFAEQAGFFSSSVR